MKKSFVMVVLALAGIIGCGPSGVVSDHVVKKALDIAYEQSQQDSKWCSNEACYTAKVYLNTPTWQTAGMECAILDDSDVNGKKAVKGCLLKDSVLEFSKLIEAQISRNVLVVARYAPSNKDIILLKIHWPAERQGNGFTFRGEGEDIAVNLSSRKIGKL